MRLPVILCATAGMATLSVLSLLATPDIGEKAPALTVRDLGGRQFSLKDSLGSGPVLVSFWATWCMPCREEFPLVSRLAGEFQAKSVSVISVAVKDKEPAVRKFAAQMKPVQRVALDAGNIALEAWDLRAVPSAYLVGRDGRILAFYDQFGEEDLPAIRRDIQKALAAYSRPREPAKAPR